MTRVVALHGAAGAGKSTLTRLIGEHLGNDCHIIQENLDEILAISSSNDGSTPWYRRRTAISASDKITHRFINHINPLAFLMFSLTVHFLFDTVWPILLLFIICLAIGRLCRWLNSHILSKMWLYNVFLFTQRQKKSNARWIWRDRTCVDAYTYCLLDKVASVPSDMSSLLLDQTNTTSVAIILDVSEQMIMKHLRTRMNAPTSSRSFAIATRLILAFRIPIRGSIAALPLIEQWYRKMNVPVIKISQLRDRLDYDTRTGEIQWSKQSINVLLETIEQAIQQRGPPILTIDEPLMPWQTV